MTEYKVGDKVRFVDESGMGWGSSVQDRVYTVTKVDPGNYYQDTLLYVDDPEDRSGYSGAYVNRFELVEAAEAVPFSRVALESELQDVVSRMRAAGYDLDVTVMCPPTERQGYTL